jgi:long-chain fatty acid transport protein
MLSRSLVLSFSLLSSPAWASGFALNAQSAESLGSAMAGVQAERAKPSSAYYNPASIVGIDSVAGSLTVFGVIVDSGYDTANANLLGGIPASGGTAEQGVIGDGVFPDAAIAVRLNDKLFFGLSLNAPFGFSSSYSDGSVVRYQGTASKVTSGALTSIIGLEVNDQWAIAGGFRVQYTDISLDGAIDAAGIATAFMIPGFTPGTDDATFELGANDFGYGYVVGVQGELSPQFRVGASFTSKIEHDFRGQANFETGTSIAGQTLAGVGLFQDTGFALDITAPAQFQFGAALDVSPKLTLLASTTLTRWSRFEQIVAMFDNPAQPAEIITQNWRDTWTGSLGAEFEISSSSKARIGVMYDQSPLDDNFASPRIPDADRVWLAAGYSTKIGENATMHLGASYIFIADRTIAQPATLPENLFRGSLATTINVDAVIVSAGVDFGF